jgi:hypothetical protein
MVFSRCSATRAESFSWARRLSKPAKQRSRAERGARHGKKENREARPPDFKVLSFAEHCFFMSLDPCLNAGIFERALGRVRLSAATLRLHDQQA